MATGAASCTAIVSELNVVQRALLFTNGTITPVLEAIVGEPIALVKLTQSYEQASAGLGEASGADGGELICRRVVLQGSLTKNNYL